MARKQGSHIIRFAGLPLGSHEFDFDITKDFFVGIYPETDILGSELKVKVSAFMTEKMLNLDFHLFGSLSFECDRCLEICDVEINSEEVLIFSTESQNEKNKSDIEIVYITEDTEFVVLDDYIYDFALLSLPIRKVHDDLDFPESKCNPEMLKVINNVSTEKTENPQWEKLKNIIIEN